MSKPKRKIVPLGEVDIGKVSFRFWTKTQRVGSCIEWTAGCDKDGYGKFSIFHKSYRAPRIAYYLYYGVDPEKLVLHRCDNPVCVNPKHLFVGDQRANIQDMDTKGKGNRARLNGEQHGRAILSEKDVIQIRQIKNLTRETARQLAAQYGVSENCIDHAWRRYTWKHLK